MFVTSHLDYCNAPLCKLPQYQYDRLQKVLNAAARVTCLIPKLAHITWLLRELHWLPVKFRVEFKIALLVFKTLNGLAPQYLSELLVVWYFRGARDADKLEALNKRILRFILGDYSSPYNTLLSKVSSTSLFNKRIQNFLILLYKSLFFTHFRTYMKNLFSLRSSSYDLRGNYILSLSKPKTTTYGLNSFSYFSAKQWNALPDFFSYQFFCRL